MLSTRHFTLIDAKRPIKNDDSDDSSENYYNPNKIDLVSCYSF